MRPARRERGDVGVVISRSRNFTVTHPSELPPSKAAKKPPVYRLRTYTGQVLFGEMNIPGQVCGDIAFGVSFVKKAHSEESVVYPVSLDGNTIVFDEADQAEVNGCLATVSYLALFGA